MSLSLIPVTTRRPRTPWYRTETRKKIVPTPTRFSITLDVRDHSLLSSSENGTIGSLNNDGKYYIIDFPSSWVDHESDQSSVGPLGDPFSSFRTSTSPVQNTTTGLYFMPVITANLDITINIPKGVVLGSNVTFFTLRNPCLNFGFSGNYSGGDIVDLDNKPWFTTFSKTACAGAIITINNTGNCHGGGGAGGTGSGGFDVKTGWFAGGGGGGGAGLTAGGGGTVYNNGNPGSAGSFPHTGGSGGAQKVGMTSGSQGSTVQPTAGHQGGPVFVNWNPARYREDSTVFADTPVFIINNNNDGDNTSGYLYGGGGGGGGGGGAGGTGGGKTSGTAVGGQAGSSGGAGSGGASGISGASGGVGGKIFDNERFGISNGGTFTLNNSHDTGNNQVTVQGSDGTW